MYRFSYRTDDGVRLWVGEQLVVDDWTEHAADWHIVEAYIPKGTWQVRVEYFEHTGGALLQASWERINGGETWRGEYYNNKSLTGNPVFVRNEKAVDFDWRNGSPDAALPADNFSARWTRNLGFEAGTYRFYVSTDDQYFGQFLDKNGPISAELLVGGGIF